MSAPSGSKSPHASPTLSSPPPVVQQVYSTYFVSWYTNVCPVSRASPLEHEQGSIALPAQQS